MTVKLVYLATGAIYTIQAHTLEEACGRLGLSPKLCRALSGAGLSAWRRPGEHLPPSGAPSFHRPRLEKDCGGL